MILATSKEVGWWENWNVEEYVEEDIVEDDARGIRIIGSMKGVSVGKLTSHCRTPLSLGTSLQNIDL
jgi:hypothetical protein